jgi:hypothetical protein
MKVNEDQRQYYWTLLPTKICPEVKEKIYWDIECTTSANLMRTGQWADVILRFYELPRMTKYM